jgi:hypothetical protein
MKVNQPNKTFGSWFICDQDYVTISLSININITKSILEKSITYVRGLSLHVWLNLRTKNSVNKIELVDICLT